MKESESAMSVTFQHRNLPHLLLHARESLMVYFRPILTEAGLSEQQWRVLRHLYDTDTLDAAGLARRCQVLAPSLTRMLRSLEAAGLIARSQDTEDLRRQVIGLSPGGRALVQRLSPRIEAIYQTLEQRIGKEQLARLYKEIESMLAALESSDAP